MVGLVSAGICLRQANILCRAMIGGKIGQIAYSHMYLIWFALAPSELDGGKFPLNESKDSFI